MPKIDISSIVGKTGSAMPQGLGVAMAGRTQFALSDAGGLTQFGVNLVRLAPGSASALRHWHETQDEFAVVTEGQLTLIDDDGETLLARGDCVAFPAGAPNGHHIVNKSAAEASFIVVGTHTDIETGHYPDHDMKVTIDASGFTFTKENGGPLDGDSTAGEEK